MEENRKIGLTGTVPVEVILAAGFVPVDLNNYFITSPRRLQMIREAEARGFPLNLCSWIKGIYAARQEGGLRRVVGILRGDCSSTEKLLEIWRHEGVDTIPFAYPPAPAQREMEKEIESFARRLGTSLAAAEKIREQLKPLRQRLQELDEFTWEEGKITGRENHLWLVAASDFQGAPERFLSHLEEFLAAAEKRPAQEFLRLGYVGVPAVVDDLYDFLEEQGARVVFNEVQRQFAMLGDHESLAAQYSAYTYPYDTFCRLEEISHEARRRRLAGIIHYAQTFCHRQMEALLLRERLGLPLLTLEADRPGLLEARSRTRIEAFLEQLR